MRKPTDIYHTRVWLYLQEIDILSAASEDSQINERNKRTIGILRELFPELSKVSARGEEQSERAFACFFLTQT